VGALVVTSGCCCAGDAGCRRFQADIAFDGEELARRALDRCGRTRLFKVRGAPFAELSRQVMLLPSLPCCSNAHAIGCTSFSVPLVKQRMSWMPASVVACRPPTMGPNGFEFEQVQLLQGLLLPAVAAQYCIAVYTGAAGCCCFYLLQALDAAVRRHDPHALDALLMQFAAVIVSTTGAEVDRLEREITVCGCCSWRSCLI